jgi:geranylgeranyl diphosphate synthase type II
MDMNFETRDEVRAQEYLEMISLKTSVLIAAALKIGAIIGRASEAEVDLLYEFGLNLGLSFQVQDDILDVYGDPEVFGKAIGGDILANKKTFLLIRAMELAQGETRDELQHWLSVQTYEPQSKIVAVTNWN